MPELLMERPKMSLQMHETLKRYILRERRKKKEEDVANQQKIKEELKKAEINTQTLEQTKEQVKHLEIKLEELQTKKRDLFNQLKKVLNEETNLKKNNRIQTRINEPLPPPPNAPLLYLSNNSMGSHQPPPAQLLTQMNPLNHLGHQPSSLISSTSSSNNNKMNQSNSLNPQTSQMMFDNPNIGHKPQSPFHSPHHLTSPNQNNFQLLPAALKLLPNQLMPPSLNPNQMNSNVGVHHLLNASPSSSPHLTSPSPRNQSTGPPQINIKRQRSPSPPPSPSLVNMAHNQFLFNQNHLLHQQQSSRSPICYTLPSSPPPSMVHKSASSSSFTTPNSVKKVKSSSSSASKSPQNFLQRANDSSMAQMSGLTQQQQSAFSSYMNRFPPSFPPGQSSSKSNTNFPFPGHPSNAPTPNFAMSPSLTSPSPPSMIPSVLQHQFLPLNQHYLNSFTPEQAQKLLFQQQQQQQQHLSHQHQLQMMSASGNQPPNMMGHHPSLPPSSSSSSSGGGSGSILTGFSIKSSGSSNNLQHPPF